MVDKRPIKHNGPFVGTLDRLSWETTAGGETHQPRGACCMTKEAVNAYKKNPHFQRNEAIYILYTVDKLSMNELAETWDLAVDEVKKIIVLHTQYWEATESTA
jgi:hypothetical protein